MSVTDLLVRAGITRILMVDDDLREGPTLAEVNACAPSAQGSIEAIMQDPDHDATERLVKLLQQENRPHATLDDLFRGLAEKHIRQQCLEDLVKPYDDALKALEGFKAPLLKIQSWFRAKGKIVLTPWPEIRELEADQFYDLLLVDYYLVENESGPTRAFIKEMLEHHKGREQPLLVILMSTNKGGVKNDLSLIRDEVGASASRFRMLVKPSSAHMEPEPVVKEKWMQTLTQLANERILIHPIEGFIHAWEQGLTKATKSIVKRLYELDASAFAILSATAKADSMSIEEYMADVLAKRVSAETEEHSEVLNHTVALQTALADSASAVNPTINQGVEIRDAQHAIRRLMSDVVWHRTPWHQPSAEPPEKEVAPIPPERLQVETAQSPDAANDAQQPVIADASDGIETAMPIARAQHDGLALAEEIKAEPELIAAATPPVERLIGITENRLAWMKRNLRFGTVLREKHGLKRYFVNITQACDVQNVKFDVAADYHYLFIRGEKLAVDRVAKGEKVFESPYYAQRSDDDEFYSFHWRLRQPFTPSMTDVLEHLEDYSIEGQLRNESAYAVLAKFLSQASRVALLRMPKIYRCPVYTLHREKGGWHPYALDGDTEVYASCWEKKSGTWCSQFQMDDAFRIVSTQKGLTPDVQAKSVAALGKSTSFDVSKGSVKNLGGTPIYLVRLTSDADLDIEAVIRQITSDTILKEAKNGDVVVVIRSANSFG